MIPSSLKLNNSPSAALNQPTIIPEQIPTQQTPEPPNNYEDQIISEEEFSKQYEGDTKIAADASVNQETGAITITQTTPEPEIKPPLTDAEALENTEMFMHLREGAQSAALAYFVDGALSESEKYNYPEPQFKKLVAAWRPMIQRAGLRFSPWINIVITEVTCTGPLVMVAIEAHRYRKEVEELRARNKAQEAKINQFEKKEVFESQKRSADSQNKWKVDNLGYFTYNSAGTYIKAPLRHEKPNLTRDYELLCRHNGKEFIDKVFKVAV